MLKGLEEMEGEFCEALYADMKISAHSSIVTQITATKLALLHDMKYLKKYMRDTDEETELVIAPGRTLIRHEPRGVVAVIGSWNYPLFTTLKVLVGSIAAGNATIVKPSEIS